MLEGYCVEWWTWLWATTPCDSLYVVAAGVEVAVEARKVAAADFDAQLVSGREVVAGFHGLKRDFVDLVLLHPHGRLVIALAVADALDVFVDVIRGAVGQHFDRASR